MTEVMGLHPARASRERQFKSHPSTQRGALHPNSCAKFPGRLLPRRARHRFSPPGQTSRLTYDSAQRKEETWPIGTPTLTDELVQKHRPLNTKESIGMEKQIVIGLPPTSEEVGFRPRRNL